MQVLRVGTPHAQVFGHIFGEVDQCELNGQNISMDTNEVSL